jgi:hypothetical protein
MTVQPRRSVSVTVSACLIGLALSTTTACGALGSVGNAKAAWAVQEPAPMAVVVRRADVADATVHQVDRLLASTPTTGDADWIARVALDPTDKASRLQAVGRESIYVESHARVVTSEAWVRRLQVIRSTTGEHANLLAAISPTLAEGFSRVMSKKTEVAVIEAHIEQERRTLAATDLSADEKVEHEATLLQFQKTEADAVADAAPLEKALLATAKDAAERVAPAEREKLVPVIAALLEALAEADVANSAAALRYPLAVPSMMSSVEAVVPGIVADIVEERAGKRPDSHKLTAHVALSGTDVSVSIVGLGPTDLGSLSMDTLTRETMLRTASWVTHATTLLATVDSTKGAIAFERDALTQIMEGLAPAPLSAVGTTTIASATVPGSGFATAVQTK